MEINKLSDLAKLFELCRKKGVESIAIDGLSFKFGTELPHRRTRKSKDEIQDTGDSPLYTEEDYLNWSVPNVE